MNRASGFFSYKTGLCLLGFLALSQGAFSNCPHRQSKLLQSIVVENGQLQVPLEKGPRTEASLKAHLEQVKSEPDNLALVMELGLDYLALADQSRWNYLEQASDYFEKVAKALPANPLVLMYQGQAVGAKALNMEPSNFKRLRWARAGFKFMDKAIQIAPDCFFLRLLRAEAQLMAHPILLRGGKLEEDTHFLTNYLEKEAYTQLPPYLQARIQLFMGNYCFKKKRVANSKKYWQTTIELASHTPLAKEAQQRLQGTYSSLGFSGE